MTNCHERKSEISNEEADLHFTIIYTLSHALPHILYFRNLTPMSSFEFFFNFFFVHTHFEIWVCKLHHRVPLNWSTKKSSSNTFWMHSRLLIDHLALMNRHYARWNYLFVHPFIDSFMRASSQVLIGTAKSLNKFLRTRAWELLLLRGWMSIAFAVVVTLAGCL